MLYLWAEMKKPFRLAAILCGTVHQSISVVYRLIVQDKQDT